MKVRAANVARPLVAAAAGLVQPLAPDFHFRRSTISARLRRFSSRIALTLAASLTISLACAAPAAPPADPIVARDQTIRIRLIDGRNGRPLSKEHLQVRVGRKPGRPQSLPTDSAGVALLHVAGSSDSIDVRTYNYLDCRPNFDAGVRPTYSVEVILKSGAVGQNSCGNATAQPAPGELVLFARTHHHWGR